MASRSQSLLRKLPSVDAMLKESVVQEMLTDYGHDETVAALRAALETLRAALLAGEPAGASAADSTAIAAAARRIVQDAHRPHLRRVVNATGIILHTGLGRAFMPEAARTALSTVTGYCNLQQDLETGQRDQREDCLRELDCGITGAEDVLVVNNNAAATLLVLAALARGKEAVISRGELIEIGGSFRLPDIMQESGAILREVGTTNKTHLRDYDRAVSPQTGLLLKAHKSNYKIVGFAKDVAIGDLAAVGHQHGIPVVDDLGCGALVGLERFGLPHEGTVQESLAAGADLVLFSTDKLIGGPQGGMIVGRRDLIARLRSHPLYRAFRVCKLTLAALEATCRLFKAPDCLSQTHPVYMMIGKTPPEMEAQAGELAEHLRQHHSGWSVTVSPEISYLGGGALPEEGMPSFAVRLEAPELSAATLAHRLRLAPVPVVARIHEDSVILDMRTVLP